VYRYLFGPVPSRRFGRSLGVDLVPAKTCTADCVFCQLGRTRHQTLERCEYVPTPIVLDELQRWFAQDSATDYVTLAGSGEPTLHSRFGAVLEFIRSKNRFPSALLSNGMLFHLKEVRAAASAANVIKIALSAWDQVSFMKIVRPPANYPFARLLEGYAHFRSEFSGQIWLEVFVLEGLNSRPEQIARIAALAREFSPDRIHLNTTIRPPAEPAAKPVTRMQLLELAEMFQPRAEVIAEFSTSCQAHTPFDEESILSLVRRHPCTRQQIADAFGLPEHETATLLARLERKGRLQTERHGDDIYYVESKGERGTYSTPPTQ